MDYVENTAQLEDMAQKPLQDVIRFAEKQKNPLSEIQQVLFGHQQIKACLVTCLWESRDLTHEVLLRYNETQQKSPLLQRELPYAKTKLEKGQQCAILHRAAIYLFTQLFHADDKREVVEHLDFIASAHLKAQVLIPVKYPEAYRVIDENISKALSNILRSFTENIQHTQHTIKFRQTWKLLPRVPQIVLQVFEDLLNFLICDEAFMQLANIDATKTAEVFSVEKLNGLALLVKAMAKDQPHVVPTYIRTKAADHVGSLVAEVKRELTTLNEANTVDEPRRSLRL